MKQLVRCSCFLILVGPLIADSTRAEIRQEMHSAELTDAVGDVRTDGDNPGKDVARVVLDSDGESLGITAILAEPVVNYLAGYQAGDVITVLLDVDNDQTTGGKPFFYETPGFEFEIDVGACIEYEGGGMACAGGLGGAAEIGYFSTYSLKKYTDESNTELVSDPFNWKDRGVTIEGERVKVSIPYASMGLEAGQTVRLTVKERDDATFKQEYLPEVLLTLK
jgi:hypothetical protein